MSESDISSIKILAVDDNDDVLYTLEQVLSRAGYTVVTAGSGSEALELLRKEHPDVVLSDVVMPKMDGYQLAAAIKADPLLKYTPVMLVTSRDSLQDTIQGLDAGADDYIHKPYRAEELLSRLKAVLRTRQLYQALQDSFFANKELRTQIGNRSSFDQIIGQSEPMQVVYSLIEKVCNSDVPVLISGESGTGKELVARAIHFHGHRSTSSLVVQNCSAFSDSLLESEIFGHVRGAFTGAIRDKKGLFEVADKGTFFLDELGEMSMALQAKLLRVLQDGKFTPVGSTDVRTVDVRIVAATNRNLEEMIEEGTFREDLYYRLNVVNIVLPPLRERKGDIPYIVEKLLADKGKEGRVAEISKEVMLALCSYDWPGNVRELRNEVERMTLMAGSDPVILREHLSDRVLRRGAKRGAANSDAGLNIDFSGTLKDASRELEAHMIRSVLQATDGNKSESSRVLGISRSSLISKVKQYGIG